MQKQVGQRHIGDVDGGTLQPVEHVRFGDFDVPSVIGQRGARGRRDGRASVDKDGAERLTNGPERARNTQKKGGITAAELHDAARHGAEIAKGSGNEAGVAHEGIDDPQIAPRTNGARVAGGEIVQDFRADHSPIKRRQAAPRGS